METDVTEIWKKKYIVYQENKKMRFKMSSSNVMNVYFEAYTNHHTF